MKPAPLTLRSSAPVGAVPVSRRVRHGAPSCKESLMRHPPRSVLLAVDGASALVGAMAIPVVTAQGPHPACSVEYSVTSPWDNGLQSSVKSTNNLAVPSSWSLRFDFAGGQKITQGWIAEWPQSGTTATAGNEKSTTSTPA
ncbi:cellulose binding domain-containing protein [Streptomyces sp. NPDC001604]|uniref:cellulose binding domain-containing protein n=1 Tax=Streptomyces sp. NPDC001604 TaxID=3364593 RepID=UPI003679BC71